MKKKIIIIVAAIVAVAIALTVTLLLTLPHGNNTVSVTSITLSESEITLNEGGQKTLIATVKPDNATNKTVAWSSSDPNVADVKDGTVYGRMEGTATITAAADGKKAECSVTVLKAAVQQIDVESISLSTFELALTVGDEETLTVTYTPDNATDKSVIWSVEPADIVAVENGKVTALSAGEAVITATTTNNKTATCSVTVNNSTIAVESISLNKSELTLEIADEETLSVIFTPSNATDKTVNWTSSAPNIVNVDNTGKVQALSAGSAVITATTANNKTATCSVTVNAPHSHNLTRVPEQAANCTTDGHTAYYTCSGCDKWFADANGTNEINDKTSVVIPKGHNLTLTPASASDCQTNGHSAYYTCSGCDKWFTDAAGANEITDKTSVVLPKGPHNYGTGNTCTVCGAQKATEGLEFERKSNVYYVKSVGTATDKDIIIPSKYEGLPVTGIDVYAFDHCDFITSVTLPDSITSIGNYAFNVCPNLMSITLPAVNRISFGSDGSFNGCYRLIEIYNKSQVSLTAGSNNNGFIAKYAKNIYTEEGGSKLTTDANGLVVYDGNLIVNYLGTSPNVTIPAGMAVNDYAFWQCISIASVIIPNGVTNIGQYAFYDSSLAKVTIYGDLSNLHDYAFIRCNRLVEVCNKTSVEITAESSDNGMIGRFAKNIYTNEADSKLTVNADGFVIYDGNTLINYLGAKTEITLPSGITNIYNYAFAENKTFTGVTISSGVTEIGESAFLRCSSLTDISIAETVTAIKSGAFMDCTSLKSITIPGQVTVIESSTFRGCTAMTEVTLPAGITQIGNYAFASMSSLKTINFRGTQSQWNSITKSTGSYNAWNYQTSGYSIKYNYTD